MLNNTTTAVRKNEWNTYAVTAEGTFQVRQGSWHETQGAWEKRVVGGEETRIDAIEGEILFKAAQKAARRASA